MRTASIVRRTLLRSGAAMSLLVLSSAANAQFGVGTAFTYQGRLTFNDAPLTDTVDLRFRLFDAPVGSGAVGGEVDVPDVAVVDGVFTAPLDFGSAPWNGQARWLEIQVRPGSAVGAYTALAPRQPLSAAPYALYAANAGMWESLGTAIKNANTGFVGINRSAPVNSTEYFGVQAPSTGSNFGGMYIRTTSNDAKPYYGYSTNAQQAMTYLNGATGEWRVSVGGIDRLSVGPSGFVGIGTGSPQSILHVEADGGELGLWNAPGSASVPVLHFRNSMTFNDWVLRHAEDKFQIATETVGSEKLTLTDSGRLGLGTTAPTAKLHLISSTAETVVHAATTGAGPAGVFNIAAATNPNTALSATTIGPGTAIEGLTGADASSNYVAGVGGYSTGNNGIGLLGYVSGVGEIAAAVVGLADGAGWAGFFEGDVYVAGALLGDNKQFWIDNPARPEEEYLAHAAVESDELKNMYDGVVVLDEAGAAAIGLPDWFQKLNGDFRYQLTPIGGAMPSLHVADELAAGRFRIAGGSPGKKVSWQVTGRRIDPAAAQLQFEAVRPKLGDARGKYLNPSAYGQPPERRIGRFANPRPAAARGNVRHPEIAKRLEAERPAGAE